MVLQVAVFIRIYAVLSNEEKAHKSSGATVIGKQELGTASETGKIQRIHNKTCYKLRQCWLCHLTLNG